MLGAILANSIVKTIWYLEFVHTSTRVSYEESGRLARNFIFNVVSCKWVVTFTPRPHLHHTVTFNTDMSHRIIKDTSVKTSKAPPENRTHVSEMLSLRPVLLHTTRLHKILVCPTGSLHTHVSEDFQGPTLESNPRHYDDIFSSVASSKQDFYVVLWNIRIMRKWLVSFRTIVQETRFGWRYFDCKQDTSNTYWQFAANSPREFEGGGGAVGGEEREFTWE